MRLQLTARTGHPDLLDLPWPRPLASWDDPRLVEVEHGIARHVVRFVELEGRVYALKELPARLAAREYRLLRRLDEEDVPVVEVVGVVSGREDDRGEPLDAVLVTRHLEFALPYRALFARSRLPDLRQHLLDALSGLLVRLHLEGFYWGDCSLSNTLFRRDAGTLAAYLVDTETGELHPSLTDGQRGHDIDIARENIAGELLDVVAAFDLDEREVRPFETADAVAAGYAALWSELVEEETFQPDERYRVEARLRRVNELGFDVDEIHVETAADGVRLRFDTQVVEPGHHRRRLFATTGLHVQENQARRLLNDIAAFRAHLAEQHGERGLPDAVVAHRWLSEVFEPVVAMVPDVLRGKREVAEIFHEVLEHKYLLSQREGRDVGYERAVASYVEEVLPHVPDEYLVTGD